MSYHSLRALETKSAGVEVKDEGGGADDVPAAIAELTRTLEEKFTGLKAEVKTATDDAKAAKDRAAELETKLNRPGAGGNGSDAAAEHKALGVFVRSGDNTELKAMSVGSDPAGGYLVHPVMSTTMTKRIFDQSPMRRMARVETITSGDAWEEPVDADESDASWVGENSPRPETDTPELGMFRVQVEEIYANQKVSQRLIDDASVNVGAWVEGKVGDKFGRKEGVEFITGSGVLKPKGIMTYDTSTGADTARAWGTIQHVISGSAAAVTADGLKDLYWGLRAPYRNGAKWLMASSTANAIDKLKDGDGQYLWRPGMTSGSLPTLLGHEVEFDETMPAVAAGAFAIAFANWQLAYLIVDKAGIKFLHDPYTAKPHVMIYAYKRVGGGLANSDAIKLQKISA